MARAKIGREIASAIRNIISPKDVSEKLKNRPKKTKQSGTPGGNIPTKSNKKPTSKPIDDEKGYGRGRFQKGSAPAPENQNVSTRVEDDAADFVNKGGAGKVESRGGRMVRGTVGDGNKSSSEAGKEKARLSKFIRESDDKEAVKKAKRKLAQMNRNDEAATDKARSSATKTRRATTEKNRGKIKDPAGHFMQTGEIVEGFNPTPNQIKKANMNAGRRKAMPKKGGGYMKKKMAGGGPLKTVDVENNPGLAKLSTPVRNKMGFAKGGGKVYKYGQGGGLGKTKGKKVSGNDGNSIVAACYD